MKSYSKAIDCFHFLLENLPEQDCKEVFLILPNLYTRCNKRQEATDSFKKACQYFPENLQLLTDFASHLDLFDPQLSSKIYLQLLTLLKSGKQFDCSPSIQVYNNMGVTFMKSGFFQNAFEAFEIGLKQVEECLASGELKAKFEYFFMSDDGKMTAKHLVLLKSLKLAILYNKAMLEESRGRFREAVQQYRLILQMNPLMLEARLRLVRIFHLKGKREVTGRPEGANGARTVAVADHQPGAADRLLQIDSLGLFVFAVS